MDSELLAKVLKVVGNEDAWEHFAFSSYVGTVLELFDRPTVFILNLKEVTSRRNALVTVSGILEYVHMPLVRFKEVEGSVNIEDRTFEISTLDSDEVWHLKGHYSENWRVMFLKIPFDDGSETEVILLHEDTAGDLIPDDESP